MTVVRWRKPDDTTTFLGDSQNTIINGLAQYTEDLDEDARIDAFLDTIDKWRLIEKLYIPDEILIKRLEEFKKWCSSKTGEDPGRLMEEIALLSLRCLRGADVIKSYQSYAAQFDLLVSGSSRSWLLIMQILHLDNKYRSIMVEAKNLNNRVNDNQFSRFCYHIQNTFTNTVQLGIFYTRFGATGFPMKETKSKRQRKLSDAQATQILFHAKNNKFVVVFNQEEILALDQAGSLISILEKKIRQVEGWTGLPINEDVTILEVDLPKHLARYFHE